MDDATSKAAEELFKKTLKMMQRDPSEYMSPEMKRKMTPQSLQCMGICGISYFVGVGLITFFASFMYTIPTVCENDPSLILRARLVGCYMTFNVVVNFILVCTKRSFYNGGYVNSVHDIDKRVCLDCSHDIPPRVHHCSLCRRCVVKRDHHCFFTGSCIGFENQRYFLVYCFYCAVGCLYMVYYAWHYISMTHGHPSIVGYYNLILPVVILQWVFGYSTFSYLCSVCLLCLCALTALGSTFIFIWQFFIALYGTTTYEFWKLGGLSAIKPFKIPIQQNLYAVFGPFWMLNFIFPMVFIKQPGDGLDAPQSKVV